MAQVIDIEVILADIERAPKTAIGSLDKATVREIWASHSSHIARHLMSGKAVKVLNFGTFTFHTEKVEVGHGTVKTCSMPVFELTDAIARTCGVHKRGRPNTAGVSEGSLGQTRVIQVNPSEIASDVGQPREVVNTSLKHAYLFLADRIRLGHNVQIAYPNLGQLLARPGTVDFKFFPKVVQAVAGDLPVSSKLTHRMLTVKTGLIPPYEPTGSLKRTANSASIVRESRRYVDDSAVSGAQQVYYEESAVPRPRTVGKGLSRTATFTSSSDKQRFTTSNSHIEATTSARRESMGALSVTGMRPATAGHSLSGKHDHDCICDEVCRERDRILQAKRDAEAREKELDRLIAEENTAAIALAAQREREKQEKLFATRRQDAEYNINTLSKQQHKQRDALRINEMGNLFESRREPVPDASKRDNLRKALDSQMETKKSIEQEERLRNLELDREQRERTLTELERENAKNARLLREKQAAQRRSLEEQMRARSEAIPKAYDAIDHIFTASEGDDMIARRKQKAKEISEEQRRLIAGRQEARTFARRAETDQAIKENIRVKGELEREMNAAAAKANTLRHDLRNSWDYQLEERARKVDLERYGQEKSLTSLNLRESEKNDYIRCKCDGPMPVVLSVKAPRK